MTDSRVPIVLVTGFLGAGKTTVINRLLRHPGLERTVVIVNELGSVSIDDALITGSSDTMIELASGCVCCTLRGTLGQTLRELGEGPLVDIDRVVVETTGLANAGPIVHTIVADEEIPRRFRFDRVVTVVDAVNGMATLDRHPEAVEQAAIAELLLVTKADLVPSTDVLLDRLRSLNPVGRLEEATHGEVDLARFTEPLDPDTLVRTAVPIDRGGQADGADGAVDEVQPGRAHTHDEHVTTFTLRRSGPMSESDVGRLVARIGAEAGANLLRVKGLVNVEGRPGPAVVQGAQDVVGELTWLTEWPDGDDRTRIVFIGWDLDRDRFESLLG